MAQPHTGKVTAQGRSLTQVRIRERRPKRMLVDKRDKVYRLFGQILQQSVQGKITSQQV